MTLANKLFSANHTNDSHLFWIISGTYFCKTNPFCNLLTYVRKISIIITLFEYKLLYWYWIFFLKVNDLTDLLLSQILLLLSKHTKYFNMLNIKNKISWYRTPTKWHNFNEKKKWEVCYRKRHILRTHSHIIIFCWFCTLTSLKKFEFSKSIKVLHLLSKLLN